MTTEVEFVQMSQDGKIIIPKKLREGFEEGTPFAVIRDKDTFLLKPVKFPGVKEFEALVKKEVKIAKKRKIRESDVDKIVHRHRKVTV